MLQRIYSQEELQDFTVNESVRYSTLIEEWNEHAAENAANIRVKLAKVKVSKTNKTYNDVDPTNSS